MRKLIFFFLFTSVGVAVRAQDESRESMFMVDTPVSLHFKTEEDEEEAPKKKKVKKKVYYGIKTKKGFTRRGTGERVTYEIFYYLKKPDKPQTFVRDLYWYDFERREIRKTANFDPTKGVLLHGPYEKRLGNTLIESGIFYKGTKHGRWCAYSRDSVLIDKEKYFRGWPKESTVSYYDPSDRKKMKEIIPIEFGEKEGYYYMFHENGKVAVTGEYHWNQKVGEWTEYYPDGKRKRVVTYPSPKDAYSKTIKPYIKTEWSAQGKEIYRNTKRTN